MNVAIILAAGQGKRFGGRDKIFAMLAGRPVLSHSVLAFVAAQAVDRVIIVTRAARVAYCESEIVERGRLTQARVVAGRSERQESALAGIEACPAETSQVWVHDAARPLITADWIDAGAACLEGLDGLVFASRIVDTVKQVEDGVIARTWPRESLWRAETPQLFPYAVLKSAHERAADDGFLGTDDASLVERVGGRVGIFPTDSLNLKITTEEDLSLAEHHLAVTRRPG